MESAVFVFEENDVTVFPSVAKAESGVEVHDIEKLVFLDSGGDVLVASADGYRVKLTATEECRSDELRSRLRVFLSHPTVNLDPAMADDPAEVAVVLMKRQKAALWPRWPRCLHRLVHR